MENCPPDVVVGGAVVMYAHVVVDLILRFARENPSWEYDRIQGVLPNVGHRISDTTVGNVLKQHGIQQAPDRKRRTTWSTFLKAHWDVLAAIDFTTVEVWTKNGLVTYYLLVAMELATQRVHHHRERNHQGLDNMIIEPSEEIGQDAGDIQCQERLGGILILLPRGCLVAVI